MGVTGRLRPQLKLDASESDTLQQSGLFLSKSKARKSEEGFPSFLPFMPWLQLLELWGWSRLRAGVDDLKAVGWVSYELVAICLMEIWAMDLTHPCIQARHWDIKRSELFVAFWVLAAVGRSLVDHIPRKVEADTRRWQASCSCLLPEATLGREDCFTNPIAAR